MFIKISDNVLTLIPYDGDKVGDRAIEIIIDENTVIEESETKVEDLEPGDILRLYVMWQEPEDSPATMKIRVVGSLVNTNIEISVVGSLVSTNIETLAKEAMLMPWGGSVSGIVQERNGRVLILASRGSTLDVPIKEGASVVIYDSNSMTRYTITEATLKDIKLGDSVIILFALTEDKEPEGRSVSVMR